MNSNLITLPESPITGELIALAAKLHINPVALATGCVLSALSDIHTTKRATATPAEAPAPPREPAPAAGLFADTNK